MIAMAQAMRSRDRFGPLTPEEVAALPGTQEELFVPVAHGRNVHVFAVRPEGLSESGNPMIVNFHGGGFIKGRADRDWRYCAELARDLGCLVWDVDYCLAPEEPFPAAVLESYGIAEYVFAHADALGVDKNRIALAGHSAGGNLVAAITIKALETGAFQPVCVLAEYFPGNSSVDPMSRYTPEQLSDERSRKRGETERIYAKFYCDPESREAKSYLASPVMATRQQLTGFPDALIISAGKDSLRDETEQFAQNLRQAGVTVTERRFEEAIHGFTTNRTEGWEGALALHREFLQNHFEQEATK